MLYQHNIFAIEEQVRNLCCFFCCFFFKESYSSVNCILSFKCHWHCSLLNLIKQLFFNTDVLLAGLS